MPAVLLPPPDLLLLLLLLESDPDAEFADCVTMTVCPGWTLVTTTCVGVTLDADDEEESVELVSPVTELVSRVPEPVVHIVQKPLPPQESVPKPVQPMLHLVASTLELAGGRELPQ